MSGDGAVAAWRVDRASRIVAAPMVQVYDALVDGSKVSHWLPPEGATGNAGSL